jgi:predicted metal-dependent peptidase
MSVEVRPLSLDEARMLTAARLVATEQAPYLAHALFATRVVAADGLETFAVDRGWRMYVDPASLAGWGPAMAGAVLVHEVGHLDRAHAERADALGADYDHHRWNLASDTAIKTTCSRPACGCLQA